MKAGDGKTTGNPARPLHIAAVVLFSLAGLCYLGGWFAATGGLAVLGLALELFAWIIFLAADKDQRDEDR